MLKHESIKFNNTIMRTLKFFVIAALAVALSACCACRRNKSVTPFADTEWHLVQLNGSAVSSENYRATFADDGRVSGIGECNRFTGTYTRADGSSTGAGALDVSDNLVATKMMCIAPGNRETEFFSALSAADAYSIDGQRLMLIRNGDVLAIFEVTGNPAAN